MNDETANPAQAAPPPPPTSAAQDGQVTMGTAATTPDLGVAQRLTAQFAPAHLTLASIIQGVALSALVIRVEETHNHFDAVAWLLTAATFLAIVDIWHEDLMLVVAYVWLPTLFDSLVPFGFAAAELFLGYFVYGNVRGWLLAYAGCYLVGVVSWVVQNTQVHLLAHENQRINDVLATSIRARQPGCGARRPEPGGMGALRRAASRAGAVSHSNPRSDRHRRIPGKLNPRLESAARICP